MPGTSLRKTVALAIAFSGAEAASTLHLQPLPSRLAAPMPHTVVVKSPLMK